MPGDEFSKQFNDNCLAIAANPEDYHPLATNHFTITFSSLPAHLKNYALDGYPEFGEKLLTDSTSGIPLSLKIANETIAEPTLSQQTLKYSRGNLDIVFPGRIDSFNGNATFSVFVNKSAYDILYSLKMAAGNHLTGEVGDPDDYWFEVSIDVTTGNKGTLVGTWIWHNVWISNLQGVTFDNSANSTKQCTITMQYFRPEWKSNQNPYNLKQ